MIRLMSRKNNVPAGNKNGLRRRRRRSATAGLGRALTRNSKQNQAAKQGREGKCSEGQGGRVALEKGERALTKTPNRQKNARSHKDTAQGSLRKASFAVSGRSRLSAQRGRPRSNNGKRIRAKDGNHRGIYDLFGARMHKAPQKQLYRPEYNEIDLPGPPCGLQCALCNEEISGSEEILEALEVLPGEFGPETEGQGALSLPAHFRCVIRVLARRTRLAGNESIAYLGTGKFAVVAGPQRSVKYLIERSNWCGSSGLSPNNWPSWRQDSGSPILAAALSIKTDV